MRGERGHGRWDRKLTLLKTVGFMVLDEMRMISTQIRFQDPC